MPVWLAPGSTIKRWLLVFTGGLLVIVLGASYLLHDLYLHVRFPAWAFYVTLQFVPRTLRGALFMLCGVAAIAVSLRHMNRVIVAVLTPSVGQAHREARTVITAIARHRSQVRGPRIVAIGGGTGMALLLRGLRRFSGNLSVIVTVADDGGSSGRLRRELGILPPGDFRQCIAALADVEPLMAELLQYRFPRGTGLQGHSFGNLFIAAMADITGSFERALAESSRVLAVRGRLFPATLQDVTLAAKLTDRSTVEGESALAHRGMPIEEVFLIPDAPAANPEAIEAIRRADMIVIGPGSLYTSVMPNLLVPGIADAIRESPAVLKAFVCNVATEPGETDGFATSDFVRVLHRHFGQGVFSTVIANTALDAAKPAVWKSQVVRPDTTLDRDAGLEVIEQDVVDAENAIRHDPEKLGQALLWLYETKRRTVWRQRSRYRVAG